MQTSKKFIGLKIPIYMRGSLSYINQLQQIVLTWFSLFDELYNFQCIFTLIIGCSPRQVGLQFPYGNWQMKARHFDAPDYFCLYYAIRVVSVPSTAVERRSRSLVTVLQCFLHAMSVFFCMLCQFFCLSRTCYS